MNWFRRRRFLVLQWALFLSVLTQLGAPARALAPFPGAMNNFLTETMNARALRMGFVATDPRIAETVAGMGRAAAAIGTDAAVGITAGTAMTWGAVILGAVVVGAGVWYLASDHKYGVTCNSLVDCALALLSGSGHPALTIGSGYWSTPGAVSGVGTVRCSEPSACVETQLSLLNATTTSYVYSVNGTATYSNANRSYNQPAKRCDSKGQNCATSYSYGAQLATGTYTGPECASGASTGGADATTSKCFDIVAAAIKNNAYTLPDSIPGSELGKPADPATMAQVANKLWQKAANTTGYAGIPYSTTDPITAADMTKLQQSRPDLWPTVGDLTAPIAQGAVSGTPITSIPMPANGSKTSTDPGYVGAPQTGTNPSTQPLTNLGADPGTPAPDAASDTPTAQSIVDPLFNWFPNITGLSLSVPSGSCPTDTLDMWGQHLVLDQHCAFFEQYRSLIAAAMLAVWTMAAAVVLLRA
jgi:hypothetical protein